MKISDTITQMHSLSDIKNKTGYDERHVKILFTKIILFGLTLTFFPPRTAAPECKPYEELVRGFNRIKSHVFIRKINYPTASNLDFAAYDGNPMLYDKPVKKPEKKIKLKSFTDGLTFSGALKNPVMNLRATPLTEEEKDKPLAWKPFIKRAWEVVKDDGLRSLGSKINGYHWSDDKSFPPFQEVTTSYLHHSEQGVELWVKVEFAPWADFLKDISDEDGDGFRELYGKLNTEGMDRDSLAKIFSWVKHEYTAKLLSAQEMIDWAVDLASYWYPTRNTDILDLGPDGTWPDAGTDKKALRELHGLSIVFPLAVIEGKPFSPKEPIYNVFLVDTLTAQNIVQEVEKQSEKVFSAKELDIALSDNFRRNNRTFAEEIYRYGTYKRWEEKNSPFLRSVTAWLVRLPPEQMCLEGEEGWLFFRRSFEYITGGDLMLQPERTNPLPHIVELKNFCQGIGVNLLFIAVPNKEEVYYERIGGSIPLPAIPIVNPYGRKFLSDLQQAGVEVVDLLPAFLKAKNEDSPKAEPLFQKQDTHWSGRGMEIAADLIAERIKEYAWYKAYRDTIGYTIKDTIIIRSGDLTDRLPVERQMLYKPQTLRVRKVYNPDGTPYKPEHIAAPVLLIGDSFTGVFELVDCKSAGIGAHIAYRTRIPVDIITSWGGGPMVRAKMVRLRGKYLDQKRLVVYLMAARDLYNYSQGWDPLGGADP